MSKTVAASTTIESKNFFKSLGKVMRLGSNPDVIDVEASTIEDSCKTITCIIDKNNIDSMLGCALWISKMDFDKRIVVHSFHPMEKQEPVQRDQVIIFGCFIPEKDLERYSGKKHTKVFAYRDMYPNGINNDKWEFIKPCEDYYDDEQTLVDNSITYNVNQLMVMRGNPSDLIALKSLSRDIALYINFAHKGLGTIKEQEKIHNLRITLARVFSKPMIHEAIRELQIIDDQDGYRMQLDQVRQIITHHGRDEIYTMPGNGFLASTRRFIIQTFSCPSGMSRDLMKMILPVKGSCVTYEIIGAYKMYRIVTDDKRRSRIFANRLNPTLTWEEGETVVAMVYDQK